MTIAAREASSDQHTKRHDVQRLRDINEIPHRVLSHILALATHHPARYPDTVSLAIVLDYGRERLRVQVLSAVRRALDREAF